MPHLKVSSFPKSQTATPKTAPLVDKKMAGGHTNTTIPLDRNPEDRHTRDGEEANCNDRRVLVT